VVEVGRTREPALRRTAELLRRTGTPCLGVVLNKTIAGRGGGYYYYGEGYYDYGPRAADKNGKSTKE